MKSVNSMNLGISKAAKNIGCGLLAALTGVVLSGIASAQDKKDEITFNLVPNRKFVDCIRANHSEQPQARATVIRGKLNDTLILDLDGIKPELAFDLSPCSAAPFWQTVRRTPSSQTSAWPGISRIFR